jgi:hypothetical protein
VTTEPEWLGDPDAMLGDLAEQVTLKPAILPCLGLLQQRGDLGVRRSHVEVNDVRQSRRLEL